MEQTRQYIEEDEIDLRELWQTIVKRKRFIFLFTTIVTIGAVIFALTRVSTYEARALVEIGTYKMQNSNKVILDNAPQLVQKLNILFIDMFKNEKDKKANIESIKIPKGSKEFIEIKSQSTSNKLAMLEITKVVKYVQVQHQKILDDVEQKREFDIKNLKRKIDDLNNITIKNLERRIKIIKTRTLPNLNKKIKTFKIDIKTYTESLEALVKNIAKIKDKSPSLTMLEINEQRHLTEILFKIKENLIETEEQMFTLETVTLEDIDIQKQQVTQNIEDTLQQIKTIKVLSTPHNYKNTQIVGEIITNDYPIKPKKKLIVVVAFVTGLILSIFLVFFLEFIRSDEEE